MAGSLSSLKLFVVRFLAATETLEALPLTPSHSLLTVTPCSVSLQLLRSCSGSSHIEYFLLRRWQGVVGVAEVLILLQSLMPLSLRSLQTRPRARSRSPLPSSSRLDRREAAREGRGEGGELVLELRLLAADSVAIRPSARIAFPVFCKSHTTRPCGLVHTKATTSLVKKLILIFKKYRKKSYVYYR